MPNKDPERSYSSQINFGHQRPSISRQERTLYALTAIVCFAHTFAFNFVPAILSNVSASIMAFLILGTFATSLRYKYNSNAELLTLLSLAVMVVIATSTLVAYQPQSGIVEIVRNFAGILLIAWALTQRWYSVRFDTLLTVLGVLAVVLAMFVPIFREPILRAGYFRMGSLTSGDITLHPSAYLSVIVGFWAGAMGYYKHKPAAALLSIAVISFNIIGYRAQAAILLLFFVIATYVSYNFISRRWMEKLSSVLPILLILIFSAFFVVLNLTPDSWDVNLGSGRIGTWLDRSERIGGRDLVEMLFGMGPGSDNYFGTLTWRSQATHSHNDFLNVALELGIVGLMSFLILIASMIFSAPYYLRFFVMIILIAPFVSGGILFKPTVAPIMALVILHTRLMHDRAKLRSGGRGYHPRLVVFKPQY